MLKHPAASSLSKAKPRPTWARSRQGFKHQLVVALVAEGFSFREADQVISTIFESMKEALLRRESVESPFGTLKVVERDTSRKWRFGKVIRFRRYKVVLDTSKA